MSVPSIVTPNSVTAFVNGKTYVAGKDHPNFAKIRAALKDGLEAAAVAVLFDIKKDVETKTGGKVQIKGETVYYDGKVVHSTLTKRMIEMLREGFSVDPLIKFMEKLYTNPSYTAVTGLYDFLEAANIPITPAGNFLAFKKVRGDYKDIHSGTFDNSVGVTVSMPRNQVNEDPNKTCSAGLHVCSESYLPAFGSSYGNRVVICEVEPQNVVAVPKDYNNAKMRVCEYKVVGEVEQAQAKTYFASSVMTGTEAYQDEEEESYYGDDVSLEYVGVENDDFDQFGDLYDDEEDPEVAKAAEMFAQSLTAGFKAGFKQLLEEEEEVLERLQTAYDQGYEQGYEDGFTDGEESAR